MPDISALGLAVVITVPWRMWPGCSDHLPLPRTALGGTAGNRMALMGHYVKLKL
ncbi:hypothetical protein [Paenibacillus donghaensis]|uniref:hypothetical protein n=1 Tax=Paenibacillus donghaensis TaxID=414771 RepID=UPI0012FE4B8D|nr:hypothetical protein [Paenibacillus donghaensis]